jgi:tetratricopeptide (TPR) repeat protein
MGDGVNIAARLEGIAEPGGICLSEDAWRQVRDKVKEAFVDLGEKQLKNIARPMRVYALRPVPGCAAPSAAATGKARAAAPLPRGAALCKHRRRPRAGLFRRRRHREPDDRPLAHLRRLRLGRSAAFTYKGKAVDLKQIGRELNMRYVLEGSVQRAGGRMRVDVQLIEAETGAHLWAERFDKPVADLFDMQDEIVSRLPNRLGQELARAEAKRAERLVNPDSMDHYFLGLALSNKGVTADLLDKARSHFDRALDLDADNVDALVRRAWVDLVFVSNYLSEDRAKRLRSAESDLGKALKLRPDNASPSGIGRGAHVQQSRRPRDCRVRARAGDRP